MSARVVALWTEGSLDTTAAVAADSDGNLVVHGWCAIVAMRCVCKNERLEDGAKRLQMR